MGHKIRIREIIEIDGKNLVVTFDGRPNLSLSMGNLKDNYDFLYSSFNLNYVYRKRKIMERRKMKQQVEQCRRDMALLKRQNIDLDDTVNLEIEDIKRGA